MADSGPNRWYGGWSNVGADVFDEIAMSMDTTNAVRLAACSKELHLRVTSGKGSRYPNDGCGTLVAYRQVHNHKISCAHGPCNCMEDGCIFSASPAVLLAHLCEAHSMSVRIFRYGKTSRYSSKPLPATGLRTVDIIGSGDDGIVFVVPFDTLQTLHIVFVICVRSAACLSPWYMVKFWSSTVIEGRRIKNYGLCVPESTASPDGIPFEEL